MQPCWGQQTNRLLPAGGGDGAMVAGVCSAVLQRAAGEQIAPHVAVCQRGGEPPGDIREKEDLFFILIQTGKRPVRRLSVSNMQND